MTAEGQGSIPRESDGCRLTSRGVSIAVASKTLDTNTKPFINCSKHNIDRIYRLH